MGYLNIKANINKLFFCIVMYCCALCKIYSSKVGGNIPGLQKGKITCVKRKPKTVNNERCLWLTINVYTGSIENARTHKSVNCSEFLPIIDSTNYVKGKDYKRLQRWWEYKNEFILNRPPVVNREMSSRFTKERLQEAKEIWLYFEVFSQGKNWRFACYIPNWPGLANVPNNCSDTLKGLLFFPAYPKKDLREVGIVNDNCFSSPCWINFSQDMLSFFSMYLVFSINLKEERQTFSLIFYEQDKPFVWGHHYLLGDSVLNRFDVYTSTRR